MLSGPSSPPTADRPITDFSEDPAGRVADPDLSRRFEHERLRSQLLLVQRERDALRDRVGELEAGVQAKDEQLAVTANTIKCQQRQLQEVIDRYETIIAEKNRNERGSTGWRESLSDLSAQVAAMLSDITTR